MLGLYKMFHLSQGDAVPTFDEEYRKRKKKEKQAQRCYLCYLQGTENWLKFTFKQTFQK